MTDEPRGTATSPPAKILFIGVDAGDKDLITEWSAAGRLPTFRRLFEQGAWGVTQNPTGLFVGAVWPSFFSGQSPSRHGRYCFKQLRPGTYEHYKFTPRDVKAEPFWNALSRAGKRAAIIDVPKTFPSELNGVQLVDWGTHDRDLAFCASPPHLAREIEERFGSHPIHKCDAWRTKPSHYTELRDALLSGVEKKARIASHFLEGGGWDLFLSVFGESHCAGHQFWHLHDASHPRHHSQIAFDVGDPLEDVYVAIDAAVGRLISQAGNEATVIVLASHGIGPHYDGTFILDEILFRLERSQVSAPRRETLNLLEWGWEKVPTRLRGLLNPLKERVKVKADVPFRGSELALRKYFPVANNDVYGAIRLNLIGREPRGRVRQGREFDLCCEELSDDLSAIVNLETDRPLVRRILKAADVYPDGGEGLPDLLVEWNRERPISAVYSPKIGELRRKYSGSRTGDHKPDGIFFALGPSIKAGPIEEATSILDFAPTLMTLLGVPPSDDLEGKVIEVLV